MKLYLGRTQLVGPITRYAGRFNLLEVAAEPGRCPRPRLLTRMRQDVPESFVFSVRLGRRVGAFDHDAEASLKLGLDAAELLSARWLVLETPATLGPTRRNRERVRSLLGRLCESGRDVAWDPHGLWDVDDALPVLQETQAVWARDASRYPVPDGPLAYVRIPALGTASRVGAGLAEKVADNLVGFEAAFVVIEGVGAAGAGQVIRRVLSEPFEDQAGGQGDFEDEEFVGEDLDGEADDETEEEPEFESSPDDEDGSMSEATGNTDQHDTAAKDRERR